MQQISSLDKHTTVKGRQLCCPCPTEQHKRCTGRLLRLWACSTVSSQGVKRQGILNKCLQ